jgi:hypothetical protein
MIDFDQLKSNESMVKEQQEDYFELNQNQSLEENNMEDDGGKNKNY